MATPSRGPRRPADKTGAFLRAVDWWREHLGLGHNAFARRLTISPTYWHLIRTGKRPLTLRVAERVLVERPDLRYLLGEDILARIKATASASPTSSPAA